MATKDLHEVLQLQQPTVPEGLHTKCMNVATKPNPSHAELEEAAVNALEYGFPDVIKKLLSRGFSYEIFDGLDEVQESRTTTFPSGTVRADSGVDKADCGSVKAAGGIVNRQISTNWIINTLEKLDTQWKDAVFSDAHTLCVSSTSLNRLDCLADLFKKIPSSQVVESMQGREEMITKMVEYLSRKEKSEEIVVMNFIQIIFDKMGDHPVAGSVDSRILAQKPIYEAFLRSNLEELKSHPSFAAVIQSKWNETWFFCTIHWASFAVFLVFLASLTFALVVASRSSDPLEYRGVADGFRALCEVFVLIYILVADVTWIGHFVYRRHKTPLRLLSTPLFYNVASLVLTFLIIPPRLASSDWQWIFAALAFTLHGLRVLYYFMVVTHVGRYVATLAVLLKKDMIWIVIVFVVLNFSLGGSLYFTKYGPGSVVYRDNSTIRFNIYDVWVSGFRAATDGSSSDPGSLTWSAVIFYGILVFSVTIIFSGIVIAQFETIFLECATKAKVIVILNKCDIMIEIEDIFKSPLVYCYKKYTGGVEETDQDSPKSNYKSLKSQSNKLPQLLETPYTFAEVDPRPVNLLTLEQKKQEIVVQMEKKKKEILDQMEENIDALKKHFEEILQKMNTNAKS